MYAFKIVFDYSLRVQVPLLSLLVRADPLYANHLEATNDIADYIVGFYNSTRLHSKLGNVSPNAFERESTSKKPIKPSEIT